MDSIQERTSTLVSAGWGNRTVWKTTECTRVSNDDFQYNFYAFILCLHENS